MDLRAGQFDADLVVVAHSLDGLAQALLRLGQLLGVQDTVLAGRHLGGPLAVAHDRLRLALGVPHLLPVALSPGQFELRVRQFTLLALHVGLGDPHHALGRLLLDGECLLVGREVAAVPGDLAVPQIRDLVDALQEFTVVTDDDQYTRPGIDRFVQPQTGVQIQIVRRLVKQQYPGTGQQECGEAQQHALATRQVTDGAVQPDVTEAELIEGGAGALLHIPVVTHGREPLLADVTRLDGVQCGPGVRDTERGIDPQRRVENQVLRQVADLAQRSDTAFGGVSSPAISRNSVDFPQPLRPIRPVLPGPTASWKSSKTALPSGQAKESDEQAM